MQGTDRIVFLINRTTIRGRTRLQKYGFLACQLYRADLRPLGFYSDWEAYHYGPYSMDLACDLQEAREEGLIKIEPRELSRAAEFYSLAPKGIKKLPSLLRDHKDLVGRIYETFTNLNKKSLDKIIGEIYADYPEYAKNSRIKDRIVDNNPEDQVRFSLETERMIQELESRNADWESHSIDEHMRCVRRLAA